MPRLQVLISGAGIAGPALAYWLSLLDHEITIVERESMLRSSGQQIDLRGQGIVIMRMMGIEDQVRAVLCREPGMRVLDRHGNTQAYMAANNSGKGSQSATSEFELMRGDLVRILYDLTKDRPGVHYIFSRHVETYDDDGIEAGGKVRVKFSDGTSGEFDMLVGADGIGSATRRMMMNKSGCCTDHRHDLGVHVAFFTAPCQEGDWEDWTMTQLPEGKQVMTRKDSPENIRIYLSARGGCDALDKAETLAEQKQALVDTFRGVQGAQLDRWLRDLQESPLADDLYSQHLTQIRLPEGGWSNGRVVLLGDAAYCLTPLAGGYGTTAALLGAYVLAGEISKQLAAMAQSSTEFDLESASKDYERVMRPFITKKQQISSLLYNGLYPRSGLGIWALQKIGGAVTKLGIHKLLFNISTPEDSQNLQFEEYFENIKAK